jgi:glucose-6-phosphate dehydrogenase assembly protein OpcA
MKEHPMHLGVQDRACFLLLAMTEYPPAVVTMREKEALTVVREVREKVPPKELAKQRLESLTSRLEKEEGSGWFGRKNGVTP